MVQETNIRPLAASDREGVIALWQEVFSDDPPWNEPSEIIRRKGTVQPELLLVAEVQGPIVGAVVAGFDGMRGWIHHLAVDPAHRRRGVGSRLIAAGLDGLRKLGCPKVNLQIRAGNAATLAFYRSLGFEVEERISMGRKL